MFRALGARLFGGTNRADPDASEGESRPPRVTSDAWRSGRNEDSARRTEEQEFLKHTLQEKGVSMSKGREHLELHRRLSQHRTDTDQGSYLGSAGFGNVDLDAEKLERLYAETTRIVTRWNQDLAAKLERTHGRPFGFVAHHIPVDEGYRSLSNTHMHHLNDVNETPLRAEVYIHELVGHSPVYLGGGAGSPEVTDAEDDGMEPPPVDPWLPEMVAVMNKEKMAGGEHVSEPTQSRYRPGEVVSATPRKRQAPAPAATSEPAPRIRIRVPLDEEDENAPPIASIHDVRRFPVVGGSASPELASTPPSMKKKAAAAAAASSTPRIELVGSIYRGPDQPGDFAWMITQPEWNDALFIFNDNEAQFDEFIARRPAGFSSGGGNAAIRPYRRGQAPRAAGVPTGVQPGQGNGYTSLTPHAKLKIDESIQVIRQLLSSGNYRRVIYSASDASGTLGTGVFQVGNDVKSYIVNSLRQATDVYPAQSRKKAAAATLPTEKPNPKKKPERVRETGHIPGAPILVRKKKAAAPAAEPAVNRLPVVETDVVMADSQATQEMPASQLPEASVVPPSLPEGVEWIDPTRNVDTNVRAPRVLTAEEELALLRAKKMRAQRRKERAKEKRELKKHEAVMALVELEKEAQIKAQIAARRKLKPKLIEEPRGVFEGPQLPGVSGARRPRREDVFEEGTSSSVTHTSSSKKRNTDTNPLLESVITEVEQGVDLSTSAPTEVAPRAPLEKAKADELAQAWSKRYSESLSRFAPDQFVNPRTRATLMRDIADDARYGEVADAERLAKKYPHLTPSQARELAAELRAHWNLAFSNVYLTVINQAKAAYAERVYTPPLMLVAEYANHNERAFNRSGDSDWLLGSDLALPIPASSQISRSALVSMMRESQAILKRHNGVIPNDLYDRRYTLVWIGGDVVNPVTKAPFGVPTAMILENPENALVRTTRRLSARMSEESGARNSYGQRMTLNGVGLPEPNAPLPEPWEQVTFSGAVVDRLAREIYEGIAALLKERRVDLREEINSWRATKDQITATKHSASERDVYRQVFRLIDARIAELNARLLPWPPSGPLLIEGPPQEIPTLPAIEDIPRRMPPEDVSTRTRLLPAKMSESGGYRDRHGVDPISGGGRGVIGDRNSGMNPLNALPKNDSHVMAPKIAARHEYNKAQRELDALGFSAAAESAAWHSIRKTVLSREESDHEFNEAFASLVDARLLELAPPPPRHYEPAPVAPVADSGPETPPLEPLFDFEPLTELPVVVVAPAEVDEEGEDDTPEPPLRIIDTRPLRPAGYKASSTVHPSVSHFPILSAEETRLAIRRIRRSARVEAKRTRRAPVAYGSLYKDEDEA